MFTGIVETLGTVVSLESIGGNLKLGVKAEFINELQVDQSISHDGICLTVDEILDDRYTVTAIEETINKTNIASIEEGGEINLERCMVVGDRLDGHIVQGHVDQTATCLEKIEKNGSWEFAFQYLPPDRHRDGQAGEKRLGNITVEKGSICVNGVSLTVFDTSTDRFSVAIIPYTYEHTNFKSVKVGDLVNLEFDIIGKYVQKVVGEQ